VLSGDYEENLHQNKSDRYLFHPLNQEKKLSVPLGLPKPILPNYKT
jgi:hypothetical protein